LKSIMLPEPGAPVTGKQIQRWDTLPDGVVFLAGQVQACAICSG